MARISKNSAAVFILILSIGFIFGARIFPSAHPTSPKDILQPRVKGGEEAPIQIIEYIDFQCPACAKGAKYLKKIIEENSQKFHLELKYYPLSMHKHGFISAEYAECAARQGKFWAFEDYLIEKQDYWAPMEDPKPTFDLFAEWSGLNLKSLKNCLEDKSVEEFILKSKSEGKILGVRSTPTYFINEKMFVGQEQLETEITRLLNETKN